MTTVLVADDHPIVLDGLAGLLEAAAFTVVDRCATGAEVVEALERMRPDILVLDVNMPAPSGLEIARRLQGEAQAPKIVLLTAALDDAQLLEAMQLRICGLVLKESAPRQLVQCLEAVHSGDQWIDPHLTRRAVDTALSHRSGPVAPGIRLTPRELQVMQLVGRGFRNKDIGRDLGITEGSVKMYVHSIYKKLNIRTRVEIAMAARSRGLV